MEAVFSSEVDQETLHRESPGSKSAPTLCDHAKPEDKKYYQVVISTVSQEIKHKHLFNLFSLYGNIEYVFIDPAKLSACVAFSTEFEAITSIYYLAGISLFDIPLVLEATTDIPVNLDSPNLIVYGKNSAKVDFSDKQKTIYKPTSILYLFNLSKNVDLSFLRKMIETKEQVLKIEFLNETRNSALCYMASIGAAIKALVLFKNISLMDKSLKINFANESLMKVKTKGKKLAEKSMKFSDFYYD